MTVVGASSEELNQRGHPRSGVKGPLRTRQGIIGFSLLILIGAISLIGPLLAPHALDTPVGVPGSGPGHGAAFGTDTLGRDILSRVLDGGLPVLVLSVLTIVPIYVIGVTLGMTAGLAGSLADSWIMRAVDIFLVFPPLLLLLLLIAGAGTGEGVLVLGIVMVLFPGVARIVRTATLEVSTTGYVEAAVARGERQFSIARREILPNITPAILADFGVRYAGAIILAASVNFLGLGSKPPAANWGLMVAENRQIVTTNLLAVLVPAAMLALLTISVNMMGDTYARRLGRSEAES